MENKSEARAIYYGGNWHKVMSCENCIAKRYSKISDRHICDLLARNNKSCHTEDEIEDESIILNNCLLPKWERVRKYGPDEVPESRELVIIKFKDDRWREDCRIGYYREDQKFYFDTSGSGMIAKENMKLYVESWRYLNV
jgi:hypothetical protein